ncbi:UTP--glucose-1-phosphate uridylyltransferase [Pseudonocardia hierapolitana]|uniref:UTP--glucose-1-phosphate uridylyltransferase n=1 Tax=Pseudonocardia hierapolitana TaxID=1128676 RepID=A0A561SP33_9PSEU|nr:UTP--glucose-1-phosphate uridylyltransferase [Pseudonocardia hierapolitana]TWF76629.1 UTP--glucose-1-phosphate uridylyltransferase [Pseudonocardia hierapolitana]
MSEAVPGKSPFRSAVVPAAGLGTRFLPTTKAVPKELLPVIDTPGIELVAAEAAEAGAEQLLIVSSPGKDAVAAYFADSSELEKELASRGKDALVAKVRRAHELIGVRTVTQDEPRGLGHAVGCAREAIGPDEQAFAVLLPDDLVLPTGVLGKMAQVRERYGGSVLCAFDVPREEIAAYGVFEVEDTGDEDVKRVHGMVEKPAPEEAPSTFAAAGRYLLDRAVFEAIDRIEPGAGGELQLTDAIALLIREGHPVHVVVHRGGRHDLGNPSGYVRAYVDFALDDPEIGPDLRAWLAARLEG